VLSCLLKFLAHVDNFYLRQWTLLHTLAQFDQTVFSFTRVMVGLERWSRRSQHHGGSRELAAHDRNIASVIARRLFLLIRRIMFFVDHYESEILDGRKNSRSRPHHDASLSTMDAVPLFGTLIIGETGMQNRHLLAEDAMQIGCSSRRESNFGNEQDCRTALRQHRLHCRQIDGGLARSGYAMK